MLAADGGDGPGPCVNGGDGPGPCAQIAGAERLAADGVVAPEATIFRSPIAPVRTSNTSATTVKHLDMSPSGLETNPGGL